MISEIANKVRNGGRVDRAEALDLYRHAPTHVLGHLADSIRARKHPDRIVTYIIDRNVNYTNVCVARCNFCAFYRPVGSSEGYVLGFDEIFRKIDETIAVGGNQLLLQGGHNPDLPIGWYEDLFRAVKSRVPGVQAPRAVAAGSPPYFAVESDPCSERRRASCRRGPRQHSGRRRRDPRRSRSEAVELLRQGVERRMARGDAGRARPGLARRRR
jgi:2-iminoacetate synthase ThiH